MTSQIKTILAALVASTTQANDFWSGEIKTRETFQYGKFKTRMQGSGQKGTCASFFTFWSGQDDLPWSVEEWEEIDIELVPSKADDFSMNLIFKWQQQDHTYYQDFQAGSDWHEYEIVWKPTYIAWYLDGTEVRRSTDASASVRDMDKASPLFMNFWTPTWDDWGQGRDPSQMPFYTKYDYVEAYDWNSETDDFTLRFRDDFSTLNQDTWNVSNDWGFNDNSSRFMETMTYVQDGNLVLKMDKVLNPERPEEVIGGASKYLSECEEGCSECHDAWMADDVDNVYQVCTDRTIYRFAGPCKTNWDTSRCSTEFDSEYCVLSYDFSDPKKWKSDTKACRTLPQGYYNSDNSEFKFGNRLQRKSRGLCKLFENCQACKFSWRLDDELKWKGPTASHRCQD